MIRCTRPACGGTTSAGRPAEKQHAAEAVTARAVSSSRCANGRAAAPRVSNLLATLLVFLLLGVKSAFADPTLTSPQPGTLPASFAVDFTIANNAVAGSATLDFYVGSFFSFELFKITFGSDFESA